MTITNNTHPAGRYTTLEGFEVPCSYHHSSFNVVVVDGSLKFIGSPTSAASLVEWYEAGCPSE